MYKIEIKNSSIRVNRDTAIPYTDEKAMMDICHCWKHLFMEGYPHGRDTRKSLHNLRGIIFKKWANSPNVVITYIFNKVNEKEIIISICLSNESRLDRIESAKIKKDWLRFVARNLRSKFYH